MKISFIEFREFYLHRLNFSREHFGLDDSVSSLAAVLFGLPEELYELSECLDAYRCVSGISQSDPETINSCKEDLLHELGDCFVYLGLSISFLERINSDEVGEHEIQLVLSGNFIYENFSTITAGIFNSTQMHDLSGILISAMGSMLGAHKRVFRGDVDWHKLLTAYAEATTALRIVGDFLGVSFYEVAQHNLQMLESRRERGKLKGSGYKR